MNTTDQVFIHWSHWLAGLAPEAARPWVLAFLAIAGILAVFATCFAVTTLAERKILGRMQNRYGPNRVGPWGLLQPLADGVKMLIKEDVVPVGADKAVHFLAPLLLCVPVWLAFAVLPFGRNMVAVDLDAGLLFFFAAGSASELAVFMAGWSSGNKYSLLGAMRGVAQMISYEVPLVLAAVPVVLAAGSLSLSDIVQAQAGYWAGVCPRWNVFTPWGLAGFGLFLVALTAEANRSPFDLPEGESEIIAGYLTEYSGFKYALFFQGEYLGLFAGTGLAVTLFLGGWHAPLAVLEWVPSWFWFGFKFCVLIFAFVWVRATLPRLRLDQLLNLSWKFLVPLALVNLFAAAAWHCSTGGGTSLLILAVRWLLCGIVIAVPFVWLGRKLDGRPAVPRKYRYGN